MYTVHYTCTRHYTRTRCAPSCTGFLLTRAREGFVLASPLLVCNVLIIQVAVGSCGLNLQEANNVFIMSPSGNPSTEAQAISLDAGMVIQILDTPRAYLHGVVLNLQGISRNLNRHVGSAKPRRQNQNGYVGLARFRQN